MEESEMGSESEPGSRKRDLQWITMPKEGSRVVW